MRERVASGDGRGIPCSGSDRLRPIDARRTVLEGLVLPKRGARQINDMTRTDIVRLPDRIAEENDA